MNKPSEEVLAELHDLRQFVFKHPEVVSLGTTMETMRYLLDAVDAANSLPAQLEQLAKAAHDYRYTEAQVYITAATARDTLTPEVRAIYQDCRDAGLALRDALELLEG